MAFVSFNPYIVKYCSAIRESKQQCLQRKKKTKSWEKEI